ncbi:hypothetical protein HOI04_00485 [archaeon]|nr:hypothetical protein [archaeon]
MYLVVLNSIYEAHAARTSKMFEVTGVVLNDFCHAYKSKTARVYGTILSRFSQKEASTFRFSSPRLMYTSTTLPKSMFSTIERYPIGNSQHFNVKLRTINVKPHLTYTSNGILRNSGQLFELRKTFHSDTALEPSLGIIDSCKKYFKSYESKVDGIRGFFAIIIGSYCVQKFIDANSELEDIQKKLMDVQEERLKKVKPPVDTYDLYGSESFDTYVLGKEYTDYLVLRAEIRDLKIRFNNINSRIRDQFKKSQNIKRSLNFEEIYVETETLIRKTLHEAKIFNTVKFLKGKDEEQGADEQDFDYAASEASNYIKLLTNYLELEGHDSTKASKIESKRELEDVEKLLSKFLNALGVAEYYCIESSCSTIGDGKFLDELSKKVFQKPMQNNSARLEKEKDEQSKRDTYPLLHIMNSYMYFMSALSFDATNVQAYHNVGNILFYWFDFEGSPMRTFVLPKKYLKKAEIKGKSSIFIKMSKLEVYRMMEGARKVDREEYETIDNRNFSRKKPNYLLGQLYASYLVTKKEYSAAIDKFKELDKLDKNLEHVGVGSSGIRDHYYYALRGWANLQYGFDLKRSWKKWIKSDTRSIFADAQHDFKLAKAYITLNSSPSSENMRPQEGSMNDIQIKILEKLTEIAEEQDERGLQVMLENFGVLEEGEENKNVQFDLNPVYYSIFDLRKIENSELVKNEREEESLEQIKNLEKILNRYDPQPQSKSKSHNVIFLGYEIGDSYKIDEKFGKELRKISTKIKKKKDAIKLLQEQGGYDIFYELSLDIGD